MSFCSRVQTKVMSCRCSVCYCSKQKKKNSPPSYTILYGHHNINKGILHTDPLTVWTILDLKAELDASVPQKSHISECQPSTPSILLDNKWWGYPHCLQNQLPLLLWEAGGRVGHRPLNTVCTQSCLLTICNERVSVTTIPLCFSALHAILPVIFTGSLLTACTLFGTELNWYSTNYCEWWCAFKYKPKL